MTCSFINMPVIGRKMDGDIVKSDNPNEHVGFIKYSGVVTAMLPEFPFSSSGRKLGPALVAGNTIVVKPTSETPLPL